MEGAATAQISATLPTLTPPRLPQRISWQEFQKRYLVREDRFKYEWVNGVVEKTEYTMNPNQLYIQRNLTDFFYRLLYVEKKVHGDLLAEPDLILFDEHHRRPDMAWLAGEQIDRLKEENAIEVPAFVIEVISNNDSASKLSEKMQAYRKAGVQVAWHIYPNIKQVHVYFGKKMQQSLVCEGEDICSAAPVLPAFELAAQDVFKTLGMKQPAATGE